MDLTQCRNIFSSFKTMIRAYNDYVTGCVSEYGLSPNEAAVLSSLQTVSTASEIARETDVSKALVSRSVKSLKEKGLIEISISTIDKREQNLTLTPEGHGIARIIDDATQRFYEGISDQMDERSLILVNWTLGVFIKNLNKMGGAEGDE